MREASERWPTYGQHAHGSSACPNPAEMLPGFAVGDMRAVSADLDVAMKAGRLSDLTAVSSLQMVLNSISPGPRPDLPDVCIDPQGLRPHVSG